MNAKPYLNQSYTELKQAHISSQSLFCDEFKSVIFFFKSTQGQTLLEKASRNMREPKVHRRRY